MIGRLVFLGAVVLVAVASCGGNVEIVPQPAAGSVGKGGSGTGGSVGRGGSSGSGTTGRGGALGRGGSVATGGSPFLDGGPDVIVDPGCPDAAPPDVIRECDPLASFSGCPRGEGCYPFVDHPSGSGCGAQSYGTVCLPEGNGRQGDKCEGGTLDCAPGFVCVVGAKPGKHCVQLCPLDDTQSCPPGMICGSLDVEGFGVCS